MHVERERECIENPFRGRNFPVEARENPTYEQIFSTITEATQTEQSSLVVFSMCHGGSGVVQMEGMMVVQDTITHVCLQETLTHKPKVCLRVISKPFYFTRNVRLL